MAEVNQAAESFTLLDLGTQASAVQRLMRGRSEIEILDWLRSKGELDAVPRTSPDAAQTYMFRSAFMTTGFFLRDDHFILLGDHWTVGVD